MLSIVVYGRNDNHGYNLHKRAAISLNCLAEMLGDAEDELIFVDYNTPDDLPTFPEAIADTLTARARARLRILRVRPEVHRRFQQRTHLAALEPVARNVAVRASNPANRWILSTNTDIILAPRTARRLAEAVGDLPAGFYHTARFEIPEGLWESFDRADPIGTIAAVQALGVSARLNEVVYGSDPILYDGPGDFQLALRADLFEIDGFDERMILGWHVDSNLAKRLTLKRGPVASMIDHVFCYHCDHTRQATSTHRRDRLENDPVFFIDQVTRPDLPEQRQHWGCAGEKIEEIRLAEGGFGLYRHMLGAVVAPLDAAFSETRYTAASYDDYRYDARHVLPFLADLLSSYPRALRLGWCGVRRDMHELARQAWRALGFIHPIMVEAASAAGLVDGEPDPEQLQIAAGSAWLDRADLLVFEFGRAADGEPAPERGPHGPGLGPTDQDALATVSSGFLSAVLHERSRLAAEGGAAPRRFVGINCIHNGSERLFAAHVAAAATPFSSRLRHGFVVAAAPELDPETADRLLIGSRLGRAGPISRRELALARDLFGPLLEGRPITSPRLHRVAINAAIGEAFIAVVGNPARNGRLPGQARRALASTRRVAAVHRAWRRAWPASRAGTRWPERQQDRTPARSAGLPLTRIGTTRHGRPLAFHIRPIRAPRTPSAATPANGSRCICSTGSTAPASSPKPRGCWWWRRCPTPALPRSAGGWRMSTCCRSARAAMAPIAATALNRGPGSGARARPIDRPHWKFSTPGAICAGSIRAAMMRSHSRTARCSRPGSTARCGPWNWPGDCCGRTGWWRSRPRSPPMRRRTPIFSTLVWSAGMGASSAKTDSRPGSPPPPASSPMAVSTRLSRAPRSTGSGRGTGRRKGRPRTKVIS